MLQIAIVEDDDQEAKVLNDCLNKYAQEHKSVFSIQRFSDGAAFLSAEKAVFDLVFMDVEMPFMDGLKTAEKLDIWLHTQAVHGAHVILQTNGGTPPDRTVEQACMLAAYFSKGRDSAQVRVDYCLVKFVKKPPGARPGMVIYSNHQTAFVTPDAELAARLRVE